MLWSRRPGPLRPPLTSTASLLLLSGCCPSHLLLLSAATAAADVFPLAERRHDPAPGRAASSGCVCSPLPPLRALRCRLHPGPRGPPPGPPPRLARGTGPLRPSPPAGEAVCRALHVSSLWLSRGVHAAPKPSSRRETTPPPLADHPLLTCRRSLGGLRAMPGKSWYSPLFPALGPGAPSRDPGGPCPSDCHLLPGRLPRRPQLGSVRPLSCPRALAPALGGGLPLVTPGEVSAGRRPRA